MQISTIHIVPTIHREASGPSYSVRRLCQSLLVEGNPTKLATLEPMPTSSSDDFIKVFPYGIGPKRLGSSPKMKNWLRSETRSGNCEILHNHSLWMLPNVYPAWAIEDTACKLVISPRGTLSAIALKQSSLLKQLVRPIVFEPAVSKATAFHATSEQEYFDIRAQGFQQPVAILPNGVDVPDYVPTEKDRLKQLLFLGRIHPIKGIDNLLKAWQKIQDPYTDWKLTIAGPDDGGYLVEMKNLAIELGLKRIEFVGPLYGDEKLEAYRNCDLYVLPTHSENFGMTVAEALAAGTPAIVTKGAPWQGLEDENSGLWIDIGPESLSIALEEAFSLPSGVLPEMGKRGREWMIRDFSWERIGTDMARFYGWLVNGGDIPSFVRIN
ncbi:MAG: glycosyltransferase [Rhizobiaceae bacterium]